MTLLCGCPCPSYTPKTRYRQGKIADFSHSARCAPFEPPCVQSLGKWVLIFISGECQTQLLYSHCWVSPPLNSTPSKQGIATFLDEKVICGRYCFFAPLGSGQVVGFLSTTGEGVHNRELQWWLGVFHPTEVGVVRNKGYRGLFFCATGMVPKPPRWGFCPQLGGGAQP